MPVSEDFRLYATEQLSSVAPVVSRRMFGGLGFYSRGLFFALADDDVLYFKVDDATRGEFESAGSRPFRPFGEDGGEMGYFEVPADVLEDTERLRGWMAKAVAVAERAKGKGGARSRPRKPARRR